MKTPTSYRALFVRGARAWSLAALLGALPVVTQAAGGLCEKGPIRLLELAPGGDSVLYVATDNSPWLSSPYDRHAATNGQRATRIYYDDPNRWNNIVKTLRMAQVTRAPVMIVSSGGGCGWYSSTYTVTVCPMTGCP